MNDLFENNQIKVYMNDSGEVFVHNKPAGVTLRISDHYRGITITSHNGIMTPWAVNGCPAISVSKL